MSDTPTPVQSPLWKQLVGAVAGAAVAFMLYQGYTFTTDHLLSSVATGDLPHPIGTLGFPAVTASSSSSVQSSVVAQASSSSVYPNRPMLGPFGWLRNAKRYFSDPIAALSQSSSSSSAVPLVTYTPPPVPQVSVINNTRHPIPTATDSFPAEQIQRSADTTGAHVIRDPSLRRTAADAVVPPAPFATNTAGTPAGFPFPPVAAPVVADSASSSVQPVAVTEPQPIEDPVPSVAVVEPVQVVHPLAAAVIAPVSQKATKKDAFHQTKLPQTGFGLDVIAVTAIGAAIGRRRAKKA